ncbi:homeobox-DDT domain protein RLT1-like isoform X1 [Punica granatum]|uniref:Homeobox-DDT domain protein RLT1-like isoform X1 n=1 Tax=Punica granatum TaxID=22663 RepID=A0A6P8E7Z2_PUNGR|nr:homeobox-DDT domain protein RLT1-like isoform X1 [Punica granatum]
MEETGEVQHGESIALHKESNKKKVKTPSQLEALKEIYRVNKYPTEELKLRLAEQLGLTEKQVTNWFCNRRVRDKRLPSKDEVHGDGRQDHSSGVIVQDRGSGFGQDSSGSTKQGNRRPPVDLRDVESRSLYGQDSPSADLTYELRSHYPGNINGVQDTSSESSSALQERYCSRSMDKYGVQGTQFMISQGIRVPPGSKTVKDMGINYKPSGYLKVRVEIENAAITTVKRQLGRYYREDGPPLGVEFQPLPPGAFESAGRQSALESYYDEDPALSHSPNIHLVHHPSHMNARPEYPDWKAKKSYEEALNSSPVDSFDDYEDQPRHRSKQKQKCSFSDRSGYLAGTNSSLDMQDHIVGDDFVNGGGRNHKRNYNHTDEVIRSDHLWSSVAGEPQLYECENADPMVVQCSKRSREKLPPNPVIRGSDPTNVEGGGPSRRISKVKMAKHHGGEAANKGHFKPVRERAHPPKEMMAVKRIKNEVRDQDTTRSPPMELSGQGIYCRDAIVLER